MTRLGVTLIVTGVALAGAVVSVSHRGSAQPAEFNLHASGYWRGEMNDAGEWRGDFRVEGNTLTGEAALTGNPELTGGLLSGSVSAAEFEFVISADGTAQASFIGNANGSKLLGRYKTRSGATGVWAGSWKSDGLSASWISAHWPAPALDVNQPPSQSGSLDPSAGVIEISGGVKYTPPARLSVKASDTNTSPLLAMTVGTNVLVTNREDEFGRVQTEPEVAIDRTGTQTKIAVGCNDQLNNGKSTLGYYFSTDGGASWPLGLQGEVNGLGNYDGASDPVLDFDAGGRAFYGGIAFNVLSGTNNAVFVARALSGQTSYQALVSVASSPSDATFHDKPWLAVNRLAGSPGFGNVYVCWTKLENKVGPGRYGKAQIWTARSTNAGNQAVPIAFDGGRVVSDGSGTGSDSTGGQGCSVAVDLNGNPVIGWLRGNNNNEIVVDTCTAGGTLCGADSLVATIYPVSSYLPGTGIRINSFPSLSTDRSPDAYGYYIAAVWAARASAAATNADIYYTLFANDHWLTPIAIASSSVDEFMPTVTFGDDQIVYVMYYKRTSQSEEKFNVYLISSANGTSFSAPVLVNDGGPFGHDPYFSFMGDYIGIDATTVRQPVWMDARRTRAIDPTMHQDDIYTATISGC